MFTRGLRRSARPIVLGPAFVVATAFIDPGNVATNVVAGSSHGYLLVWVVVSACIVGAFIQFLAAKLGLATGRSLAAACRERYPAPVGYALWGVAEVIIILTDVAEFVGGALALNMLFGLPLLLGAAVTAAASIVVIALRRHGQHIFPAFVIGLLFAVLVSYVVLVTVLGVDGPALARGLVPRFGGAETMLLAAGIVGATVMPHALFLHSTMAKQVSGADEAGTARPATTGGTRRDVIAAMSVAGVVNVAILVAAAQLPPAAGTSLITARDYIGNSTGALYGTIFALALLAAALASACTGVYSGQTVMADFLNVRINVWVRRIITVIPSLIVVSLFENPTDALVLSQVGLSLCLPFALIPLIHLTSERSGMGERANSWLVVVLASAIAACIVVLNVAVLTSS